MNKNVGDVLWWDKQRKLVRHMNKKNIYIQKRAEYDNNRYIYKTNFMSSTHYFKKVDNFSQIIS